MTKYFLSPDWKARVAEAHRAIARIPASATREGLALAVARLIAGGVVRAV